MAHFRVLNNFRLSLGMYYERLAQILFEIALTYKTFSVKVPKNQTARYLALKILGYLEVIYPVFLGIEFESLTKILVQKWP